MNTDTVLRYRIRRFLDNQLIETLHNDFDPERLEEIVMNRPGTEFIVDWGEFNTKTKEFSGWERLYAINEETIKHSQYRNPA